jgi:hypothetical protein
MYGTAADIPPTNLTRADATRLGAKGIGTKAGVVVHVDVREGLPAHWTYDNK